MNICAGNLEFKIKIRKNSVQSFLKSRPLYRKVCYYSETTCESIWSLVEVNSMGKSKKLKVRNKLLIEIHQITREY